MNIKMLNRKNIKYMCYFISIGYIILYIVAYYMGKNILKSLDWAFIISIITSLLIINVEKIYKTKIFIIILIIYSSIFSVKFLKNFNEGRKVLLKWISEYTSGKYYITNSTEEIVSLSLLLFCFILLSIIRDSERTEEKKVKKLFKERDGDFEYIKKKIECNDTDIQKVFGIDGEWGDGKTYLVDYVLEKLQEETPNSYEIIKINTILIEKEDIYPLIIKNLDRVLKKNLIFTGHSKRITNFLIKNIDKKISINLENLRNKTVISDDINNFKNALSTLNKKIILVFDDIDRSDDLEKIKKILSFSCEFSTNNLVTIILYSQNRLLEINKRLDRDYVEKYIPFVRKLTPISFLELLERNIEDLKLKKDEFSFLRVIAAGKESYIEYRDRFEQENIELKCYKEIFEVLSKTIRFTTGSLTPRKIKLFLREVAMFIYESNLKIENRIIIAYMYLKHFSYDEFYEKIDIESNLEENFPIEFKSGENTLKIEEIDLIKTLIKEKEVLVSKEKGIIEINNQRYKFNNSENNLIPIEAILTKIGISKIDFDERNKLRNREEISNNLYRFLSEIVIKNNDRNQINIMIRMLFNWEFFYNSTCEKAEERKDKINSNIRKLHFIGTEKYLSLYEEFYMKMKPILQIQNVEERKREYKELLEDYYYERKGMKSFFYYTDNECEKSMKILELFATEEEKINFFYLVFHRNKEVLNNEVISTLFSSNLIKKYKVRESKEITIKKEAIRELIINKIIEGKIELSDISLYKILENIESILKNININICDKTNTEFIESDIKSALKKIENEKKYRGVESIQEMIVKYSKFSSNLFELIQGKNLKNEMVILEPEITFSTGKMDIIYLQAKNEYEACSPKEQNVLLNKWFISGKFEMKELDSILELDR